MLTALLTALMGLAFAPAHGAAAPASDTALAGHWAGGTNGTGRWRFAEATIEAGDEGLSGSLAVPGENAAGLPPE